MRGAVLGLLAAACTQAPVDDPLPDAPDVAGWTLTWADEFDGAAGAPPDPARWVHDVGGHGWGNQQLEFDTDRTANASLDGDGHLVITARREDHGGRAYTSARLTTLGRFEQQYGRFEARVRVPRGAGLWPAFWLLGASLESVGWPDCGELDVMEIRGGEPTINHGSAHGPGYSGGNPKTSSFELEVGDFAADFHQLALEWSPGEVHWFVDGEHYHALRAVDLPADQRWVFDDGPMFVIVNLAVGGHFGGPVDPATAFPAELVVDHVRVYRADGEAP